MKAYSKAQKRAQKREMREFDIDPTPKREGDKARATAKRQDRADDIQALEARAKLAGIELAQANPGDDKKVRHAVRTKRGMQLRELRAQWYGCNAGRAMASQVKNESDRRELWDAICLMRRTQANYDWAIGAPNRHAQVIRLLAPLDALQADADSPPLDLRTDEDRARQAVSAWMAMQGWLDMAKLDAGECKRVVIDDEVCRDPAALVRALHCVVNGSKGRKITVKGG